MSDKQRNSNPIYLILGVALIAGLSIFVALDFLAGPKTQPVFVKLQSPSAAQWRSAPGILDFAPVDGKTFRIIPKSTGKCVIEFRTNNGFETFKVDVKSMTDVKIEPTTSRGALYTALNPAAAQKVKGVK